MVRNVSNHDRTCSDDAISSDLDAVDYRRANSDKGEIPYLRSASERCPGRQLRTIADAAIVIDRSAGINNGVLADD
jgi:hypothetical protein